MARMAVIADDFSGCTDAEIQLSRRSFKTLSLLPHASISAYVDSADVLVIDNEARLAGPSDAYESTRSLVDNLVTSGIKRIYKKVDSTFRGNIGPELEAVLDTIGGRRCVLVPAYPANGRTTRLGRHYVHGRPISETEFARDPNYPIRNSELGALLARQVRRKVANLYIQEVRQSPETLASIMEEKWSAGADFLIADAEDDTDLDNIAVALTATEPDLVSGSAAMLGAVAKTLDFPSLHRPAPRPIPSPVLVICGSLSPVSAEQMERLASQDSIEVINLNVQMLLDDSSRESEVRASLQRLRANILVGRSAALVTAVPRVNDSPERVSQVLLNELEGMVRQVFRGCSVSNFYVIGGHTCLAVCRALEIDGVAVYQEVEPGIGLCRGIGAKRDLRMVIKPGGFGSPCAVVKGVRMLLHGSRVG